MKGRIKYDKDGPKYFIGQEEVTEQVFHETFKARAGGSGTFGVGSAHSGWPIVSDALAVHKDQVAEATQNAIDKGVPTEFRKDGRPVLRDRAHRAAYLKAYGFHDKNGGYSD